MLNTRFLHDLRIWIEWHGSALTAIATAAVAVAITAGVVFACAYLYQVRKGAYTRRTLSLLQSYQSPRLAACRADWARKRLDNVPAVEEIYTLLEFFGAAGFAVKRGFIRAEDIWETLGSALLCFHADAQELLPQFQRSAPESCAHFMHLIERVQHLQRKRSGKEAMPSPDEVKNFFRQQVNPGGHLGRRGA